MAFVLVSNWTNTQQVPLPKFSGFFPIPGFANLRPVNWNSAQEKPIPFYASSFPVRTPAGLNWLPPKPLPGSSGGGGAVTVGYAT